MKRLVIYITLILLPMLSHAQQDALYSQYMFNPLAINPGYAGTRESVSAVLLAREQWMGLDGSPSTQSVAIHGPVERKNFALGFNALNERIGPVSSLGFFGTYAYHLRTNNGKLSMALRGGFYNSTFTKDLSYFKDETDPYALSGDASKIVPSFDFGAYYVTPKYYAGISSTHLSEGSLNPSSSGYEIQTNYKRHYLLTGGFAYPINRSLVLKPSVLVRYVMNAPLSFDANMSFLLAEILWLGASYRWNNALVLQGEIYATDFLRIGYSFDVDFTGLRTMHSGTHEFMLGYEFAKKGRKAPTRMF